MSLDIKPVILDNSKCNGCVNCMKRCPTEAIRVRDGKATVLYDRCVGCGECVKVCATHAKIENCDPFASISRYKYTVALACPSIYAQFNNLDDPDYVLNGIKKLGFDYVCDVGYYARHISEATKQYIKRSDVTKPVISSACPAVVNLIRLKYEYLLENLSPMKQPEELAAEAAIKKAMEKTGLKREEIGIFLITHCAANLLNRNDPENNIDCFVSLKEIYFQLLGEMNKLKGKPLEKLFCCDAIGISWGSSTGEAMGVDTKKYLVADGIENIMTVLQDLEHEKLNDVDFLELNACTQGCVGGSINLENPFLARMRLRLFRESMNISDAAGYAGCEAYMRERPYEKICSSLSLSGDRSEALHKTIQMKNIYDTLPHSNCGECGAPNCMAFAEDVVRGLPVKCKHRKEAGSDGA